MYIEKKVWLVLMEGPNDERATYSHIESLVEYAFSSLKTQPKIIFMILQIKRTREHSLTLKTLKCI